MQIEVSTCGLSYNVSTLHFPILGHLDILTPTNPLKTQETFNIHQDFTYLNALKGIGP